MSINLTNTLYNDEFIKSLLKQVSDKIALVSNKDYKHAIYGMGVYNPAPYMDLLTYHDILERLLKCDTCYSCDFDLESFIGLIKSTLNKC